MSRRRRSRRIRAANAVRLQLLTGARIGEVLGARKVDFDLQRGVWTKPSHQTKQRRTEHLPLSAQASALIAELIERAPAQNNAWPHRGFDSMVKKLCLASDISLQRKNIRRSVRRASLLPP